MKRPNSESALDQDCRTWWLNSPAAVATLKVMPDAQNDQGAVMHCVADDVLAEDEVTHCVRLWRLRDIAAHLGKLAKVTDTRSEIRCDACCGGWIMICD